MAKSNVQAKTKEQKEAAEATKSAEASQESVDESAKADETPTPVKVASNKVRTVKFAPSKDGSGCLGAEKVTFKKGTPISCSATLGTILVNAGYGSIV